MRPIILALTLFFVRAAAAQDVLDSIALHNYPVKEGMIYRYTMKDPSLSMCGQSLSIVSVITHEDSVFHFEEGVVAGVFSIDDFETVTIQNTKGFFITYSNLHGVRVKKGDIISRGSYLGTLAASEERPGANQVDILVLNRSRQLSYVKAVNFIRNNMCTCKREIPSYSTL